MYLIYQTAIATSVNLRCFGVLSPRKDGKIGLEVPDIDYEAEWEISKLPWEVVPSFNRFSIPKDLDQTLLSALENLVKIDGVKPTGASAAVAFLYLYMAISPSSSEAQVPMSQQH